MVKAQGEPYTKVLPKPLLPVNDKPVIQHIVERFLNFGAKNFYISVNYKSNNKIISMSLKILII